MNHEMDDTLIVCPHCLAEYQPDSDAFDEQPRNEECEKCGKTYRVWQEFTITHHTSTELQP